jgi:hypothetical protein
MSLMESETAKNPSVDGATNGGGGAIAPMMVRLAWHCAGTYDAKSGTGGSDGATMRFKPESEHGGNAGLHHARELLEPIKRNHPSVSYADLYVFAGVVAVEACGGPNVGFRPGRSDAAKATAPEQDKRFTPDGRLPGADAGDAGKERTAQHIRNIFYRMGFNDNEIVALSGAHALGRCHTDRSGYWYGALVRPAHSVRGTALRTVTRAPPPRCAPHPCRACARVSPWSQGPVDARGDDAVERVLPRDAREQVDREEDAQRYARSARPADSARSRPLRPPAAGCAAAHPSPRGGRSISGRRQAVDRPAAVRGPHRRDHDAPE